MEVITYAPAYPHPRVRRITLCKDCEAASPVVLGPVLHGSHYGLCCLCCDEYIQSRPTTESIARLRAEAAQAGDEAMVDVCDRALGNVSTVAPSVSQSDARLMAQRVIVAAQAGRS